MSNREIRPHDHSSTGGNLMPVGTRHETVKDGLGLVIGYKKAETFQCKICGRSVEVINPNILSLGGY